MPTTKIPKGDFGGAACKIREGGDARIEECRVDIEGI